MDTSPFLWNFCWKRYWHKCFIGACLFYSLTGVQILGSTDQNTQSALNAPTILRTSEKSIMIVDDEQDILVLFRDYLQTKGLNVQTFQNPVQALTEFQFTPSSYSLIISDMRMPQLSGLQFIEKIRKINKDVKIIFMTAFDLEIQKIAQKNMSEFLKKPITLQELFSAVSRVLESD
jgi:DNA-binding NtrC family response regulator